MRAEDFCLSLGMLMGFPLGVVLTAAVSLVLWRREVERLERAISGRAFAQGRKAERAEREHFEGVAL